VKQLWQAHFRKITSERIKITGSTESVSDWHLPVEDEADEFTKKSKDKKALQKSFRGHGVDFDSSKCYSLFSLKSRGIW
jgi:hypothetical protein